MWAQFREQVHEEERAHSHRAPLAAGSTANLSVYKFEGLSFGACSVGSLLNPRTRFFLAIHQTGFDGHILVHECAMSELGTVKTLGSAPPLLALCSSAAILSNPPNTEFSIKPYHNTEDSRLSSTAQVGEHRGAAQ